MCRRWSSLCAGADEGANGATRLAGSLNVKEIYRQPGYPVVRLIASSKRVFDVAELHAGGSCLKSELYHLGYFRART